MNSDSWASTNSRIGSSNDKIGQHVFCADVVGDEEARQIWRGSDLGQKVVEDPPSEMWREGFALKTEDTEQTAAIVTDMKRVHFGPRYREAREYARAYGGAALMPIAENAGANPSMPLDLAKRPVLRLSHFLLLEPRELTPNSWYSNLSDPKFGYPKTYRLSATAPGSTSRGEVVHESRLIVFNGARVSRRLWAGTLPGWGDSVFTRVKHAMRGMDVSWDAMMNLLTDFAQAVLGVTDLADLVGENGAGVLSNRMAAFDMTRSVIRTIMIDKDKETFQRQQTPVTGLEGLIDRTAQRFCAAAGVPMSRLLGTSPTGLSNSDDSGIKFYYDRIAGEQDEETPNVEQGIRWVCAATDGPTGGKQPQEIGVEWRPLWQPTEKEQAESREIQSRTDERYIINGVISSETVRDSRFGGEKFNFETTIDVEALAALEGEIDPSLRTPGGMPGDPSVNVQHTVFAGPQVSAMLEIATASRMGKITPEQAQAILGVGFQLDPERAKEIAGKPMENAAEVKGSLVPGAELGAASAPGAGAAVSVTPAPGAPAAPPAKKPGA